MRDEPTGQIAAISIGLLDAVERVILAGSGRSGGCAPFSLYDRPAAWRRSRKPSRARAYIGAKNHHQQHDRGQIQPLPKSPAMKRCEASASRTKIDSHTRSDANRDRSSSALHRGMSRFAAPLSARAADHAVREREEVRETLPDVAGSVVSRRHEPAAGSWQRPTMLSRFYGVQLAHDFADRRTLAASTSGAPRRARQGRGTAPGTARASSLSEERDHVRRARPRAVKAIGAAGRVLFGMSAADEQRPLRITARKGSCASARAEPDPRPDRARRAQTCPAGSSAPRAGGEGTRTILAGSPSRARASGARRAARFVGGRSLSAGKRREAQPAQQHAGELIKRAHLDDGRCSGERVRPRRGAPGGRAGSLGEEHLHVARAG